jgi:hypothetical protein
MFLISYKEVIMNYHEERKKFEEQLKKSVKEFEINKIVTPGFLNYIRDMEFDTPDFIVKNNKIISNLEGYYVQEGS